MKYVINMERYRSDIKHWYWLDRPYEKDEWNWNVMKIMDDDDCMEVLRVHFPHAYRAAMKSEVE